MADAELDHRLAAVLGLWPRALSGTQHAAGCSCMGGFLLSPPSARELEEDVLDYPAHRYQTKDAALAAHIAERQAKLRAEAGGNFTSFLTGLATTLPAASCVRMLTDLEVTLQSIAGPAAGPNAGSSRFACV